MKQFFLSMIVSSFCIGCLSAANTADKQPLANNESPSETSTLNSLVEIVPNAERNAILLKVGNIELQLSNKKSEKERTESCTDLESKKSKSLLHKYDGHYALIELGFNNFADPNYSSYTIGTPEFLELDLLKSRQVNIHLAEFGLSMGKNNLVGVSSAIALVCNNYVFADNLHIISSVNGRIEPSREIPQPCKKAKMTTFGIGVPLSLDINVGNVYLSGGAWGELILESYTKSKFPKHKENLRYVNPLQYGVFAKIGCDSFYIYGNYALSEVFEKGKGPETNTMSVGIGFFIK